MEIKSNNGWWFSQYNMHGKWAYAPHKKTYCDHDLNILSFVQELINAQCTRREKETFRCDVCRYNTFLIVIVETVVSRGFWNSLKSAVWYLCYFLFCERSALKKCVLEIQTFLFSTRFNVCALSKKCSCFLNSSSLCLR